MGASLWHLRLSPRSCDVHSYSWSSLVHSLCHLSAYLSSNASGHQKYPLVSCSPRNMIPSFYRFWKPMNGQLACQLPTPSSGYHLPGLSLLQEHCVHLHPRVWKTPFQSKDQGPNFFVHQQQRVPEDMTHFMNGLWSYLRTKTFIFLFAKSQEKQKKLQWWGDTASSLKTFPQSHTALLWVWTLIRKRIELKLEWFAYKLWSTNCCYSSWRFAFVCLHLFYRKLKGKPSSRI